GPRPSLAEAAALSRIALSPQPGALRSPTPSRSRRGALQPSAESEWPSRTVLRRHEFSLALPVREQGSSELGGTSVRFERRPETERPPHRIAHAAQIHNPGSIAR